MGVKMDIHDKDLLEILDALARKMNTTREKVLRLAITELGNFYLNVPHEVIVVEKKTWDEFLEKRKYEIKEEAVKIENEIIHNWEVIKKASETLLEPVKQAYIDMGEALRKSGISDAHKMIAGMKLEGIAKIEEMLSRSSLSKKK